MTEFLLPRHLRKRKRAIYSRAHRALGDLIEALRDIREFTETTKPLYDELGDKAWPTDRAIDALLSNLRSLNVRQGTMPVEDVLSIFNNMSEEI
jgi:hypothetical protein